MKKIAVILLICFCSLISKPVFAETLVVEEDWDYLEITQGNPAPISGLLFSYDGMSNALARVQQKIKLVGVEKDSEREKLKIDLEAKIKTSEAKFLALEEQHQNQISAKNDVITSLKKDLEISKVKTYGGLMLGLGIGLIVSSLIYGNK